MTLFQTLGERMLSEYSLECFHHRPLVAPLAASSLGISISRGSEAASPCANAISLRYGGAVIVRGRVLRQNRYYLPENKSHHPRIKIRSHRKRSAWRSDCRVFRTARTFAMGDYPNIF